MNSKSKKIVIYGAGSIGCYLGGALISAGHDVTLIGRQRLGDAISLHGMRITDWQGRNQKFEAGNINYSLDDSILKQADYVLLTVKSGDTQAAASVLSENVLSDTVIVSFQNGVRNADIISNVLPDNEVLRGMVPFNVFYKGDGHFHCGTEGNLALESNNGVEEELLQCFLAANLPIDTYDNLEGVQWSKLVMNLNNAVNALSGRPLVEQLNDKGYRKVMAAVIQEALNVTSASKIRLERTGKVIPSILPYILKLPTWLFKRVASAMLKIDPAARSSMYEDLQLGRKTEIDFLNGEIVKLAKKTGQSAPANSIIVEMIKEAESKQQGTPNLSSADLQKQVLT